MSLIDKLLQADASKLTEKPSRTVNIERLSKILKTKFDIKLQALDPERYADIQRNAVDITKKGDIKGINLFDMQVLTLVDGIVEPSMKSKELQEHFKAISPKDLINKLFLSGEIAELYKQINELSGYDTDTEDTDEEIKN